ncbi:uncharacterized protein [Ptychodera flava]|uniref:uncharacterized protein n=1 Tax=Ptychodera flava TaxID=63121 RepID=UPI00396A47D0
MANAVEDLDTSDSDSSIDIIEISSDTSEELQPRKVFVLDSSSESSDSEVDNSEQSFHFAESLDSSSDEKSENGLPNTGENQLPQPPSQALPGRNYLAAFENSCGCEWDCLSLRLSQEDFVVAQHLFEKIGKRGAQENRFTKCDVCVALKEEKASTMDPEVKSLIDRLMEEHNTVNIAERQTYFDHRELARGKPDKYLSVIVDGMDQNKLCIPRLAQTRKSTSGLWSLRTHLTGTLVHGRHAIGYFDLMQYPHDSNLTMNIVLRILQELDQIPDTGFFQFDNCFEKTRISLFSLSLAT